MIVCFGQQQYHRSCGSVEQHNLGMTAVFHLHHIPGVGKPEGKVVLKHYVLVT